MLPNRAASLPAILLFLVSAISPVFAQNKYDVGASDTEIKIGNTMPYSGPASAYGTIGKVEAAYFRKINDEGGINGRKITFITLDDAYSPPKTVEMTRRLVEQDQVLLIFQSLGTASNAAVHKYLNQKKIPQLFIATGSSKWNDPKNYPWTIGWQPNYHTEGLIYARHILKSKPDAKVAVLYQNDDYGKDVLQGLEDGFGAAAGKMIVAKATYEVSDPTIDSQIVQLQSSGATIFVNIATPKFAAMAIRKAYDVGWKPTQYVNNISSSVGSVLIPAGLEKATGLISSVYLKDPSDDRWKSEKGMKDWAAFMAKYYPDGDVRDLSNVYGYAVAQTMVYVLKQAGNQLTRENIMKQATSLKDWRSDVFYPGISLNTSDSDYVPIKSLQLNQFNGQRYVPFGEMLTK